MRSTGKGLGQSMVISAGHTPRPDLSIHRIDQQQHAVGDCQQQQRRLGGSGIVERLHLIVNIDRDRPRLSVDVASHHQHDTELPQRMGKAQHRAGDEACRRQRNNEMEEGRELRHPERPGGFDQPAIDLIKGCGERLHGKRQAVENRREEQTFEGEGERDARPRRCRIDRPGCADRSRPEYKNPAPSEAVRAEVRQPTRQ